MYPAILSFVGGVVATVVGAWVTHRLSHQQDASERRDAALFEVYMMLMELNADYFWMASSEVHRERPPVDTRERIRNTAWRIADKLRTQDDLPHMREILTVLMSESSYETAQDRHDALGALLGKLGNEVNPKYNEVIKDISPMNMVTAAQRGLHQRNAPGLLHTLY